MDLFEARRSIAAWRKEYDKERPHSSLGHRTPKKFAGQVTVMSAIFVKRVRDATGNLYGATLYGGTFQRRNGYFWPNPSGYPTLRKVHLQS